MPWTVSYAQDTAEAGIGTATARFSDVGKPDVAHARRLDTNKGEDIQAFTAECVAKLAEAVKATGDAALVVAKVEAVLNGA